MKDDIQLQGVELTIVGTLAKHPESFRQVREHIRPEMFVSEQGIGLAEKIWAAMVGGKWNRNVFAASITKLEAANIEKAMNLADLENIQAACIVLKEKWEVETYGSALADVAINYSSLDGWQEADEILGTARRKIMQMGGGKAESPEAVLDGIAQDLMDGLLGNKTYSGISTGFDNLDALTGGWNPAQQIIVAARPGQGKTRLGVQFAYTAAKAGVPVVFYSREIKAAQIYRYVLSFMSLVKISEMKTYHLSTNQSDSILQSVEMLKKMPLYVIDDTPTIEDVRYSMLEMAAHKGVRLFVVDYIQLLASKAIKRTDNRNNELAHISRTLKTTAMETDAANIVLAQLNRETERRAGKRPQLSDLRDSGALEADADLVIFPYDPAKMGMEGQAELIVEKQRDGKNGCIAVAWKDPGFFYEAEVEVTDGEDPFYRAMPFDPSLNGKLKPNKVNGDDYVPF